MSTFFRQRRNRYRMHFVPNSNRLLIFYHADYYSLKLNEELLFGTLRGELQNKKHEFEVKYQAIMT
jgi:hypothetical protein